MALKAIASKDPTPVVDLSLRLAEIHLQDLLFGQVIVLKAPFFAPEVEDSGILASVEVRIFGHRLSGLPRGPNIAPNVSSSAPDGSRSAPNVAVSELASPL